MQPQHVFYMQQCLQLAETARQQGNIPVGSLLVRADQVIATASELLPTGLDITAHAEVLAIRQACYQLNTLDLHDCILYTTAEPCWMCSYAIRATRIGQVVIGAATPTVGGISSRYPILVDDTVDSWGPPPQVMMDILAAECQALRQQF